MSKCFLSTEVMVMTWLCGIPTFGACVHRLQERIHKVKRAGLKVEAERATSIRPEIVCQG